MKMENKQISKKEKRRKLKKRNARKDEGSLPSNAYLLDEDEKSDGKK